MNKKFETKNGVIITEEDIRHALVDILANETHENKCYDDDCEYLVKFLKSYFEDVQYTKYIANPTFFLMILNLCLESDYWYDIYTIDVMKLLKKFLENSFSIYL